MDIFLSGDIRKDKTTNGYVLNPSHYPNFMYFSGTSSIGSGAQFYNIVLDSFDYSGNFIERKSSFYNRGTTGGGAGIDIYWNNIGYSYNLYISGSSSQFTGFSGITTTNNSYDYTSSNQYRFTLNGLPNYSGLTITSAATYNGSLYMKLDIPTIPISTVSTYTANSHNLTAIVLDSLAVTPYTYTYPGLSSGVYSLDVLYNSGSDTVLEIYDGADTISGTLIYRSNNSGVFPYTLSTAFTFTLTSNDITLYNSTMLDSIAVDYFNLYELGFNTTTKFELSGNTKNLIQYSVNGTDFNVELYRNSKLIRRVNESNTYSDIINFSGQTSGDTWVSFVVNSNDEVRLSNIKIFPIK